MSLRGLRVQGSPTVRKEAEEDKKESDLEDDDVPSDDEEALDQEDSEGTENGEKTPETSNLRKRGKKSTAAKI